MEFDVVGRLFLADFVTIITLAAIFLFRRNISIDQNTKKLIMLLSLWLVSQIVTDLVRETPINDLMRGWSKIALTLVNLVIFSILLAQSKQRARFLLAGIGSTMLLGSILSFSSNPLMLWKMGGTVGLATLLLAIFRPSTKTVTFIILLGTGLVAALYNARSGALFCFATAIFLAIWPAVAHKSFVRGKTVSIRRLVLLLILGFAVSALVYEIFSEITLAGWLGKSALEKFHTQLGDQGPLYLIACGRVEWTAYVQAIIDSPVIGHGSWARDMAYRFLMARKLMALGCPITDYDLLSEDVIPTHSLLFGAWVEAGFMGAVFWVYAGYIILTFLNLTARNRHNLKPLLIFLAITLLWDILFSPFGAARRLITPAILACLLQAIRLFSQPPRNEVP